MTSQSSSCMNKLNYGVWREFIETRVKLSGLNASYLEKQVMCDAYIKKQQLDGKGRSGCKVTPIKRSVER